MAEDVVKKIPLPKGFDSTNPDHMMMLTTRIQETIARNPALKGYSLFRVDDNLNIAFIAPMNYETDAGKDNVQYINLQPGQAQTPKTTVKRYETDYPGWYVVDINPVKNILSMERLDNKTLDVRRVIANCLKVNPWDIRVTPTPEKGWKVRIRKDAVTYVSSKYDRKIQEAVENAPIGQPGWFFKADTESNVVMIYPGKLPTFKKLIAPPKIMWEKADLHHAYFGMKLPDRGRETGDWIAVDWKQTPGVLVCGKTSGGKSTIINSLIYGALKAGMQLAVCDDKGKRVDFQWCRPWVMDKGWGCDGYAYCTAVLTYILQIYERRMQIIEREGKVNWWELPDGLREENPPILLVCDEIAQWAAPIQVPSMAKDNPAYIKANWEKGIRGMNLILLRQVSQKVRAAGIFFLFATQSPTLPNGLDPSTKQNLAPLLLGDRVKKDVREHSLSDPTGTPTPPENLISEGVAQGVGVAELTGQEACVFKGVYADGKGLTWPDILKSHLVESRPPEGDSNSGHWAWEDVCAYVPYAAEKPDDGLAPDPDDREPSRLETEGGFGVDGRDVADRDQPLKGAAAAAHVSAIEAARQSSRLAAERGM